MKKSSVHRKHRAHRSDASAAQLINGVEAGYIDVQDRGLQYGDGLFETILCHDRQLFFWQQHYSRLRDSAARLDMACPAERELLADIARLLDIVKSADACHSIKLILTRGSSVRGYRYPEKANVRRIVSINHLSCDYSALLTENLPAVPACVCRQQLSINEDLAGLKHLNRLDNVLARSEWGDEFGEGLMLNADGHVIEGTMSNLFAVQGDRLITPRLERSGVAGIMRQQIIDIAARRNIGLDQCDLTLEQLAGMDGLFLTNSLFGMRAIASLEVAASEVYSYPESGIMVSVYEDLTSVQKDHAEKV